MSSKSKTKKKARSYSRENLKENVNSQSRPKSPTGLPTKILIDNHSMYRIQSFKTTDFSRKISYDLIDSVYDRTILKKIITKYKFSIVPNYFQIQVENIDGTRNEELERLVTPISAIISRNLLMDAVKGFFLYGTSIIYKGDVNERGEYNQLFLLRIQDLEPEYDPEYGYRLVGFRYYYDKEYVFIPLEDVAIFANDPAVGELFGTGLLNNLFETLNQFLNDKLGLTEILDRYALPLVQWAVDVSDAGFLSEDEIRKILYSDEKLRASAEIVSDDGKYTARGEGGRADLAVCFYEKGSTEPVRMLYDLPWYQPSMKKLKGREGYLLIFHAVDDDPARTVTFPDGRKWNRRYTAGAALFDKQDPTKLTAITKKPLLVAETPYETGDLEHLWTEFTVFPCGSFASNTSR